MGRYEDVEARNQYMIDAIKQQMNGVKHSTEQANKIYLNAITNTLMDISESLAIIADNARRGE